jgi:hypothetical protein
MKRAVLFGAIAILLLGLTVVAVGWFGWRSEIKRLKNPESVTKETGLQLPSHARITATQAHIFSLADGANYEWLIKSDSSLLSWVTTNMSVERDGWEHVRSLAEICDFKDELLQQAKFGGVWKGVRQSSRGREETSYLYLAADGKVGVLTTFRP